eukprot:3946900-Pleurochrysis_carterae.AAC.1
MVQEAVIAPPAYLALLLCGFAALLHALPLAVIADVRYNDRACLGVEPPSPPPPPPPSPQLSPSCAGSAGAAAA